MGIADAAAGERCAALLALYDQALPQVADEHLGHGVRPAGDQFHGRLSAEVVDPFGHRWTASAQLTAV